LRGGDWLMAAVGTANDQIELSRLPVLATLFPHAVTRTSGPWRVSILKSAYATDTGKIDYIVAIERTPDPREERLAPVTPRDVWWEVSLPDGSADLPVVCEPSYDFPVPCWRLSATAPAGLDAGLTPRINVWWLADHQTAPSATLVEGIDFKSLHELVGRSITVAGKPLRIEEIRSEKQSATSEASSNSQPCLTVTLSGPPNHVVWLRIGGPEVAGHEHRSYSSIGRYIGRFWPVSASSLTAPGVRLEFVTLDDLKRAAEQHGTHTQFDAVD
jgi:hypothetical protein